MTQEQLISRYNEILDERIALKNEEYDILTKMIDFAPHKLGEIINYKKTEAYNDGTFLNPKIVTNVVGEGKAVVTGIHPTISFENVRFAYEFSPLKKDGKVSKQHIYLAKDDIEWTGEMYQGTIE